MLKKERDTAAVAAEGVDDEALAVLVSMGYDEKKAEESLRIAGPGGVEAAIPILDAMASEDAEPSSSGEGKRAAEPAEDAEAATRRKLEKEEADREVARKQAEKEQAEERERQVLDEAREVIERELGRCLRRGDMEDGLAGAWLEE